MQAALTSLNIIGCVRFKDFFVIQPLIKIAIFYSQLIRPNISLQDNDIQFKGILNANVLNFINK